MTSKKALTEARIRWGKNAAVSKNTNGIHYVGKIVMGMMFQVEGSGKSFEEAFAESDKRKERELLK